MVPAVEEVVGCRPAARGLDLTMDIGDLSEEPVGRVTRVLDLGGEVGLELVEPRAAPLEDRDEPARPYPAG